MHPFSAHLEPDLRLWSDFEQNPNHVIKIKKFLSVTHVFSPILEKFFIRKKYGVKKFFYKEKFQFPPYFRKFSKVDEIHVFSKFSKNRDFARLKAQPLFNIF